MNYILQKHEYILDIILDYYYIPNFYQEVIYLQLTSKYFCNYVKRNINKYNKLFYVVKDDYELGLLICKWNIDKKKTTDEYGHISKWNTSNITSMKCLFIFNTFFNDNISMWITHNVYDMSNMFAHADNFNQDISKWNTKSVVNMNGMFLYSKNFNQDISKWNTSNVVDMGFMFHNSRSFCKSLNSWNLSSVKYIGNIFTSSTHEKKLLELNFNISKLLN